MNLKSTLWTLAFAVAAVSCSDELEEGGGTGTGNEENGEGVYVTVNVGMASGPTTKAGETGNGDLEDSEMESAVNDINIYLIPKATQSTAMSTNDLSMVNENDNTEISSGYSEDLEPATGAIDHHDAKATVEISVPDLNEWYHVVAVVNAGKALKFTKLAELRDYLQTTLWKGDNNKYGVANDFVMSTHQMYQENAGGSDLFVSQANSDPSNPAETTVYVERLAARIDMQLADGLVSEDGSYLNGQTSGAKVKLAGYQVINQLVGGTYMLKRVSGDVTTVTGALADAATTTTPYLDDEHYTNGSYNYVLDPWTANKKSTTAGDVTTFPETIKNAYAYYSKGTDAFTQTAANNSDDLDLKDGLYKNHFEESLNGEIKFTEFDENIKTSTSGEFTPLLYTGENTMDVGQQKNGFTTGVIFKASYAPAEVSKYDETSGSVKDNETYTAGNSFFIANYEQGGTTGTLANDLRTIAALGLPDGADAGIVKYMFNETSGTWPTGKSKSDFEKIVNGMSGGALVIAYQDYLLDKLETVDGIKVTFEGIQADLTWSKFVSASNDSKKIPSDSDLKGANAVTESENLMKNYNIAYYAGDGEFGVTNYLKYWIKHEPRDENEDMGVMEYAIVRNNVYQLQVSGIKNLGDPLPFTPGVDDPDNPNKETDIFIMVNLYVRNWVKRSNTSIIL